MNEHDDDQPAQVTSSGDSNIDSGLGHDPLEWLEDDDEVSNIPAPVAASAPETAPPPEPEIAAQQAHEPVPEPAASPVAENQSVVAENQSVTYENHKAILKLPEKLTVQIIEPLHSEWKTLLYDLPQSLEIDASLVRNIDATGMQLFYAMVQQMVMKGSDVAILNVEPSLKLHFKLFGLESFFIQYIHAA